MLPGHKTIRLSLQVHEASTMALAMSDQARRFESEGQIPSALHAAELAAKMWRACDAKTNASHWDFETERLREIFRLQLDSKEG